MVLEHQHYLEAVRELTDWLMTAGEELQHWSDTSGDSASIKRKLSEVRVRQGVNVQICLLMLTDTPFVLFVYTFLGFDSWTIPDLKKTDQFLIHTLTDNSVAHVTGDKPIVLKSGHRFTIILFYFDNIVKASNFTFI